MPIGKQMTSTTVEQDTAHRLRAAIGRVARRLRSTTAGSELTPTDTSVLFSVVVHGPIGVSELAELEDVNPTMLSRILARLTEQGLIVRTPSAEDRRVAVVEATPSGEQLRVEIRHERALALGRELDLLDPEHRATLEAAVPALEALAEQMRRRPA